MQNNILFDNVYIGNSIEDAEQLKKETFDLKLPVEKAEEEASFPHPQPDKKTPGSPSDLSFKDDPVTYVKEKLGLFLVLAQRDPINAIKFLPEVAGGIAAVAVTLIALIIGLVGLGASSPAVKETAQAGKDKAKKATDKAVAKITEIVDDAQDKVAEVTGSDKPAATKRSTRSG
jgi:calnexin